MRSHIVLGIAIVAARATAVADAFDPLHPDGWPKGYTIVQLRHLPACGPEGLPRTPGAVIQCRPSYATGLLQWSMAVDWTTGATFGDVSTLGGAHGAGIEANLAVLRNVQLGGRYELLGIRLADTTSDNAYASQLFGQLKARWFTDEVRREAWTLGAGYGWAMRPRELGDDGALVRISLAREAGLDLQNRRTAMTAAIELAYERSLGDTRFDAALASIRLGFETQIRPAANLGEPPPDPWSRTTAIELFAPGGFGMALGLRATPSLSFETSGSYLADLENGSLRAFDDASWAVQTGVRYQLQSWPTDYLVLYGLAQGGVAWYAHEPAGELEAIQTAELGIRALCSTRRTSIAFDLGGWLRTHVDDGKLDPLAAGIVLRVALGTDRGAIGGRSTGCQSSGGGSDSSVLTLRGGGGSGSGGASAGTTTTITLVPPAIPQPPRVNVNVGVTGDTGPTSPPPPLQIEPVQVRSGFVWIGGHWEWRGGWTWRRGHWERERPGHIWTPGRWDLVNGRYVWVAGRWDLAPQSSTPPPIIRDHRGRE